MPFELPEIDGVEPDTLALIQNSDAFAQALEQYVSTQVDPAVTARVDVAKQDFKNRMDAMNAKLQAAQERAAMADLDPEELQALRDARDQNPELKATLEAMKDKEAERQAELAGVREQMQGLRMKTSVNSAVDAYNTANPARRLKPDATDLVTLLARDALQFDPEKDDFKVMTASGEPMATDKGAATLVDWLHSLRDTRPSLFDQPTGGGAPGSASNGSADKTITRDQFAQLSPQEQANAARTLTVVD